MQLAAMPAWLKKRIVSGSGLFEVKALLKELGVHTVCESGLCPNLTECFSRRFTTFLILGKSCTRRCSFCSVIKSAPEMIDESEVYRMAQGALRLGIRYAVLTSVTRDDLDDGGAGQFVKAIETLRQFCGGIKIEVLVPDFLGDADSIKSVLSAAPDVFGHNIETVKRLYPAVRKGADYNRSLELLKVARGMPGDHVVKSGIMVGLGEFESEVVEAMRDIREAGCDILTIGQYLRPGPDNIKVDRFADMDEFDRYVMRGKGMGFKAVVSGAFVRSSYMAESTYKTITEDEDDRRYAAAAG